MLRIASSFRVGLGTFLVLFRRRVGQMMLMTEKTEQMYKRSDFHHMWSQGQHMRLCANSSPWIAVRRIQVAIECLKNKACFSEHTAVRGLRVDRSQGQPSATVLVKFAIRQISVCLEGLIYNGHYLCNVGPVLFQMIQDRNADNDVRNGS